MSLSETMACRRRLRAAVLHLVTLDPINVVPDRTLTVTDTGAGLQLRLQGPGGPYYAPPDGYPVENSVPPVKAHMQRRIADGDDLLSWESVFDTDLEPTPDHAMALENLELSRHLAYDPTKPGRGVPPADRGEGRERLEWA